MADVLNIKNNELLGRNLVEGGFKFNISQKLWDYSDVLNNPDSYKESIQPSNVTAPTMLKDKLQIGNQSTYFYEKPEGSSEEVIIKDPGNYKELENTGKTLSQGFFCELPSVLNDVDLYYPLASNLKGILGKDINEECSEPEQYHYHPNIFKIPTKFPNINNLNNSKLYRENFQQEPLFIDRAAVSCRKNTEAVQNLLKFKDNKNSWKYNIYYSGNICPEEIQEAGKFKDNIVHAKDKIWLRESNKYSSQDMLIAIGPIEIPTESIYSFSLYAKASNITELGGLYLVPEQSMKGYFGLSNINAYKIDEKSLNLFEYPKTEEKIFNNKTQSFFKIKPSWQHCYKVSKCSPGKYYAVIVWPSRTINNSVNRQYFSGNTYKYVDLKLAGLYLTLTKTPRPYDGRNISYIKGEKINDKQSSPLWFSFDLTSSNSNFKNGNWVISYFRKIESYTNNKESSAGEYVVDSLGDASFGYKGSKIFLKSNISGQIFEEVLPDINKFYNHWEHVFVYPKNSQANTLIIEVFSEEINPKTHEYYSYKKEMNISSFENSFDANIKYNLLLAGEPVIGANTVNLFNGYYKDLLITTKDKKDYLIKNMFGLLNEVVPENNIEKTIKKYFTVLKNPNIKEN